MDCVVDESFLSISKIHERLSGNNCVDVSKWQRRLELLRADAKARNDRITYSRACTTLNVISGYI